MFNLDPKRTHITPANGEQTESDDHRTKLQPLKLDDLREQRDNATKIKEDVTSCDNMDAVSSDKTER